MLFGGLAKDRPYPGSTIVTAFNQGVTGLVKTLAAELAPTRVNAVHPGVVGDTPRWVGVDHPHRSRTPIGRLVSTAEVVDATEFLLANTGVKRPGPGHRRRAARHLTFGTTTHDRSGEGAPWDTERRPSSSRPPR